MTIISGLHKWQNLIISENLKIHGVHFYIYGTMKLFTKVLWLYFVKVLSFPNLKTCPCALRACPRARLSHDCIFSNFCGQNFVSREVTQRPRVKTKPLVCRFMAFVFKFQFSPQYLFCQTRILDQLKLLQLSTHGLECLFPFVMEILYSR